GEWPRMPGLRRTGLRPTRRSKAGAGRNREFPGRSEDPNDRMPIPVVGAVPTQNLPTSAEIAAVPEANTERVLFRPRSGSTACEALQVLLTRDFEPHRLREGTAYPRHARQ